MGEPGDVPRLGGRAADVLIPATLATTVPAEALLGRLSPAALLGGVGPAGALLALSRWLWSRGVRRYSGASA
ncbi:MAG TPA: ABC-2 family transporter protein [Chloroflexota bacterium]